MRTLIVENEKNASELLTGIIAEYYPSIELIGVAPSVVDAFNIIKSENPDLVFLDVELDDGLSFDLLDLLKERPFRIIFTTAFDQYALKAFRYDAVDYILKPYTPSAVVEAIQRVSEREESSKTFQKLNALLDAKENSKVQRIALHTSKGLRLCDVNEIIRLEADSSYCTVYLENEEKVMLSRPLGEIEKKMPVGSFYRVHTSHSVNVHKVKQVIQQDGGYIEMKDGTQIPLARRRKQEFINLLK